MLMLEENRRKRANIKRNISRIKGIVEIRGDGSGTRLPSAELQCRLGILEAYFKQAMSVQTDIENEDPEDEGRADLEDSYVKIKLCIKEQLGEDLHNTVVDAQPSPTTFTSSRLPRLTLPVFDGNRATYKNFITSFNQIVAREHNLSNIEKFNHLLNCLKGPALETVQAFQVTSENYQRAIDRLNARFDNPTLTFLETIAALFKLQPVNKPDGHQLRSLLDKATAMYSSLSSLGSGSDIAQAMLIYIVIEKCDHHARNKWNEALNFKSLPTWEQCSQVLERHCQFLQSSGTTLHSKSETPGPLLNAKQGQRSSSTFTISKAQCALCSNSEHKLAECSQFKSMSTNHRFDFIKKCGRCINCLGTGHRMAQCPSKHRCRSCSRSHHTLLHNERPPPTQQPSISNSSPPSSSSQPVSAITHSHSNLSKGGNVILATAMVLVKDSSGTYKVGRALLDSCSQVNFLTEEFAQKLRLRRDRQHVEIRSIGDSRTNINFCATTSIKSRVTSFELSLQFCITPHIAYQPDCEIDTSNWNLPANTPLADESFNKSRRVDLLLGTETFFDLLSVGQIKLGRELPTLQKTLLGWVVSGRYQNHQAAVPNSYMLSCNESIDANLQHLWTIDAVDTPCDSLQPDQQRCEEHYSKTTFQLPNGRLVVSLPFKQIPDCLGNSIDIARRRFLGLERRLLQSPDLRSQYIAFMQEYEQLGHMKRVSAPKVNSPHYYIPHHCVLKPTSVSTKLRVVFDASCRTSSQHSLNDLLLVGPSLQDDLYIQLLRFRLFRFAVTADITKMYRQVLIRPSERRYQYILWRTSPDDELQTYELNTVTYGTASAPYLAVRSLQYLADLYMAELPLGASVVKSSFYVDDLLCGANDVESLHAIKTEVTEILRRGMFPLTKWHSNHPSFVEIQSCKELNIREEAVTSALGITWNQVSDTFLFTFTPKGNSKKITKRSIMSIASSLFDPLGLLSPLVIVAKIILQELWLLKVDWDESLPQAHQQAWLNCLSSFNSLSSLFVPRYCLQAECKEIQLHGFCDASLRAYGCCFYVRTENRSGDFNIQLLTAKSRVAPVKKQSLPKLELCGAHLLSKLYVKIKHLFNDKQINAYFWSDSQIVLHWLQQHSATLSTFVGNRVSDIQQLTIGGQWKYVPTKSNPADIVSRGCTTTELQSSIWFSGPAFLRDRASKWPLQKQSELDMAVINSERRKTAFTVAVESNTFIEAINKFSSYNRCLRIVAYMFRFSYACRKQRKFGTPSPAPEELSHALNCIVWNLQQQHFQEDFRLLQKHKLIKGNLKYLSPFLDDSSGFVLIKVGGRLENATIPSRQKHPILLPRNSEFVKSHVRHLHIRNYHAGPKALVALLRLQFWVVNARDVARQIVRSCVHCVRYRPTLLRQIMGNLPAVRVTADKAFRNVGIDFCGPIDTYVRIRGKGPTKSYIAIFVCLVIKAVHIEVVSDLSTNKFLDALKRMIARRGPVTNIYCDNATNFVGACNKLRELKSFMFSNDTQAAIQAYCSPEEIHFHFIPPRAPHFGGLWEAAVKSAKGLLGRSLRSTRFTFEELNTAVIEIEAVLNSRPLTPLSSDPNDFGALTAGHFLTGDSLRALPEKQIDTHNISNLDKYNQIAAVKQKFWRRWSAEYFNELRARSKWTSESPNLSIGAMVIIHEDNISPQRWKLGRVESVVKGRDDRVRVVHVRTATGVCCRPIHKLALLPAS